MSSFKKQLFTQFAHIAKAMSSANRLEILEFLAQREYSVEDLAQRMDLSIANTSHHLQQLRHAGLVTSRKDGLRVFYRLSGNDVSMLLDQLRGVAERHLDEVGTLIDTYLRAKDDMEPIPRDTLLQRAKEGSVTVLDVRPAEEFAAGHLPGAINIPLADLKKQLGQLDSQHEIVAYCRGPYCVLAFDAVKLLREQGLSARRLEDGFPEWQNAGLPVEKTDKQ
ncbi:MAG: metalloregulator ArsR/SmtB family transcription factor [Gammaproteobacteria bacterium]|nr:metalloregulator ArsR/SmtB family transcription factor [Gammaproteobacteria bacterium]